ncbi:DUF3016 domain-containing protein [Thalassotalea sp. PP2-459]|uniref:DUF3016 domain-containing protein n=1 Tax=Thalassotalea sp. PP2-459 TaxID=1742724 RepID=UPI0009F94D41|nr:DUF3016 domain-containing protein [Thalassotalea sp. PP2-459]
MYKVNRIISTLLSVLFVVPMALAGTSEVTWQNPDKYRDVYAGQEHRAKFKKRVFKEFEQHFAKLAEQLPKEQVLKVTVTDVDLAGDVHETMERIRVIKDIHIPRMKFSYQLVDASEQILQEGEEHLKDMGFMMRSSLRYNNSFLHYEKVMLDDWFESTFKQ